MYLSISDEIKSTLVSKTQKKTNINKIQKTDSDFHMPTKRAVYKNIYINE